ncbi:hypothetical protein [Klebsiella quasipneumoniae]|uniref:hypothetical protein n=1 Tax=Klebsiella quasipneumoniae TaxID=1463165 RepID=UPI0021BE1DFE|nr:hypothetical protein [Klebsiella quasipneumoniae]MCT8891405.1 hypothetical protein [Klebsiella quasipneumoniae subsp. similipneumoniae]
MRPKNEKNAAIEFKNAFNRLKNNNTRILPAGTKVTQNNVSREAGYDPSALKKSRHPSLVLEIQEYISDLKKREEILNHGNEKKVRDIKERLDDCRKQRDKLMSIVIAQNEYILQLINEVETLSGKKVVRLNK